MKRFYALLAVAVMAVCLSGTAQANVFSAGGDFVIKFRGFEYAYVGTHDDFMDGSATVLNSVTLPNGDLTAGFSMASVMWTTAVYPTGGAGHEPASPYPVYSADSKEVGIYVSVVRDLYADSATGNATDGGTVTFTGGYLDWYHIPYVDSTSLTIADLNTATWVAGVGLVLSNGNTLDSYLSALTPFVTYEIAGNNGHTGVAQVYTNEGGQLEANVTFHANVINPGSTFDSNAYGGFDLSFQADLKWWDQYGRFSVDDPAYVTVSAPTPEPASLLLMSMGLLVTGYVVRRNRRV